MTKLTAEAMKFIIARLLDNANDAYEEAKVEDNDFQRGRKLAYFEVLDTIKNELIAHDQDLTEFGLENDLFLKL